MKTRKVNRYYCEYCKKSGCSAYHMKRHEDHCTMNPNRKCRLCERMEEQSSPELLQQAKDMLPDPAPYWRSDNYGSHWLDNSLFEKTLEIWPQVETMLNNCPNCKMAALRQKGIPVTEIFDYRKDLNTFWAAINDALKQEQCIY